MKVQELLLESDSMQHELYVCLRSKGKLSDDHAEWLSKMILQVWKTRNALMNANPDARAEIDQEERIIGTDYAVTDATSAMGSAAGAHYYYEQAKENVQSTPYNTLHWDSFYMTLVHTLPGKIPAIAKYFRILNKGI
jgi:hypothetical protein